VNLVLALVLTLVGGCQRSQATETRRANLPNPFFAMNFWQLDPKVSSSPEAQARLLKELGYDGMLYLGALDGMKESFRALDSQGLEMSAAAVIPYDISVDPGQTCPASLKEAIKQSKGGKTLLLIQFQSKALPKSSPEGDARAVELGRELADFARKYGVRLAIYPHVNIWCERIDHAVRIAKQCGRKNLGVSFNLTHWLWTDPDGNLERLSRDAMPHLFLVTINGINRQASLGALTTLDRGDYDVAGFLKPFVAAGYRGPIGLQCVSIRGEARENLARSMAAWEKISGRLGTEAKDRKDRKSPR